MKRFALLLLAVFCLVACRKIWDKIHDGNQRPSVTPCRVVGWIYGEYYPRQGTEPVSTSILYDDNGNPISVDEGNARYPGTTHDRFTYDSRNRVILYDRRPENGYTVYVYQGNSTSPVRDTLHTYLQEEYISHFSYDAKKRINSVKSYLASTWQRPIAHPDTTIASYYYDANGNRQTVGQPLTVYNTSKYGIYSLHPTWRLIFVNYSINCTTAATTFNEYGLPLTFNSMALDPSYSQPFYGSYHTNNGIGYECSGTN
jgi:hypothetical protein